MLPKDHDGVIISGKRKKGKSTLLAQLLYGEPRVVLYDAKGELREPIECEAGDYETLEYANHSPRGVFRCYVPCRGKPAQELEWSAYLATKLGRCIYVVDELPDALEGGDPGDYFSWVTRMGRKRAIRFVYCFQRPQEVPRMATSQAADWYLHQTNEQNELQYIKASVCTEAAVIVKGLPQGHSVHVKDGTVCAIMHSWEPGK